MDGKWLSYVDAAAALGMTPESVRQRARREHWRKQLGNDGKALILVPADTDRIPAGDTDGEAPAPRPVKRPDTDIALAALQARLVEMEARARELYADVERERGERLQERERADQLTHEVGSLARQLAQAVQEAGAREANLRAQFSTAKEAATRIEAEAKQARAELAAWKARPWWRRLAG
jgi:DNA repair exonuclease SbcCD ATPase subunit